MRFPGTPNNWDPLPILSPYHSPPSPESLKTWEACMGPAYHKKVPCPWESLESPLKKLKEATSASTISKVAHGRSYQGWSHMSLWYPGNDVEVVRWCCCCCSCSCMLVLLVAPVEVVVAFSRFGLSTCVFVGWKCFFWGCVCSKNS